MSNNIIEVNRLERVECAGFTGFRAIRLPPVQTVGLFGHHLRQFMRLAAGWRCARRNISPAFDGRERVTVFRARLRPPPMPHRHQLFLYASLHQAVLCASADADAKNASQHVANSTRR